jgi:hypothetical protein
MVYQHDITFLSHPPIKRITNSLLEAGMVNYLLYTTCHDSSFQKYLDEEKYGNNSICRYVISLDLWSAILQGDITAHATIIAKIKHLEELGIVTVFRVAQHSGNRLANNYRLNLKNLCSLLLRAKLDYSVWLDTPEGKPAKNHPMRFDLGKVLPDELTFEKLCGFFGLEVGNLPAVTPEDHNPAPLAQSEPEDTGVMLSSTDIEEVIELKQVVTPVITLEPPKPVIQVVTQQVTLSPVANALMVVAKVCFPVKSEEKDDRAYYKEQNHKRQQLAQKLEVFVLSALNKVGKNTDKIEQIANELKPMIDRRSTNFDVDTKEKIDIIVNKI